MVQYLFQQHECWNLAGLVRHLYRGGGLPQAVKQEWGIEGMWRVRNVRSESVQRYTLQWELVTPQWRLKWCVSVQLVWGRRRLCLFSSWSWWGENLHGGKSDLSWGVRAHPQRSVELVTEHQNLSKNPDKSRRVSTLSVSAWSHTMKQIK